MVVAVPVLAVLAVALRPASLDPGASSETTGRVGRGGSLPLGCPPSMLPKPLLSDVRCSKIGNASHDTLYSFSGRGVLFSIWDVERKIRSVFAVV